MDEMTNLMQVIVATLMSAHFLVGIVIGLAVGGLTGIVAIAFVKVGSKQVGESEAVRVRSATTGPR